MNMIDGPGAALPLYGQTKQDEEKARKIYQDRFKKPAPAGANYDDILFAITSGEEEPLPEKV